MIEGLRIAFESMLRGGIGAGIKPSTELILMFRPAFCRRMIGRTALVARTTPKKFTSNNAWAWFTEDSSAPASRSVPALFTRTSILPVVSKTLSPAAVTNASSVTSQSDHRNPLERTRDGTPAGAEHSESSLVQRLCGGLTDSCSSPGHNRRFRTKASSMELISLAYPNVVSLLGR
jgi:hypothetical protein